MDLDILLALNGFAGRGDVLDALLVQLSASPVFKGIPLMMLVWGLWMVPHAHVARRRAGLAATLVTAVLALAAQRNLRDMAIVVPPSDFGAQSVAAVQAIAPTLGIRLRAPLVRSAAGGLTDALAAGGGMPDAVYLPAADATLRPFAEALAGQGIQLIGSAQWAALDLEDERAFRDAWFAAPDPLRFAPFRDAFAEAAGQAGGIIAGLAYDGTDLLRVLAQRGAQTRAGLLSEEGFSGVLGPYRFLPSGQCQRGLAVLKVGAGDFSLIGATSV